MNLTSDNWYTVTGGRTHKIHFLHKDDLTLCSIHKTHLQKKPLKGNYVDGKICKRCLNVLTAFDDLNNFTRWKSTADNYKSNQDEQFYFPRYASGRYY